MKAGKARLLILVSRQGHCLNDLLFRAHSGQLPVEIAAVASNHTDHAGLASSYGIPFHHLPVTPETRPEQEQQIIDLAPDIIGELVLAVFKSATGQQQRHFEEAAEQYRRRITLHRRALLAEAGAPEPIRLEAL